MEIKNNEHAVMLICDNQEDCKVYDRLLQDTITVIHQLYVNQESINLSSSNHSICILLDLEFDHFHSEELMHFLERNNQSLELPVILITDATHDEFLQLNIKDIGALDCLYKPLLQSLLPLKIQHYIDFYECKKNLALSLETQQHLVDKLSKLSKYDSLTNVYNRRQFLKIAENIKNIALRHHEQFAFIVIDIDEFNHVNDTLGHDVGDKLLIEITLRLTNTLRKTEIIARIGGDEFGIIFPKLSNLQDAGILASKLLQEISKSFLIDNHTISIHASIGIACFPSASNDINELFKQADIAMHRAKNSGKNSFQFYSESLNRTYQSSIELQVELSRAIEREEFYLVYQPCIEMMSGKITGVEALIRWHNGKMGIVPPDKFIPIAERCGFIKEIDNWVLIEACKQYKKWVNQYHLSNFTLSINFSPSQFVDNNFAEKLTQILENNDIDMSNFTIELTETAFDVRMDEIATALNLLFEKDCNIAIDDFGTGFSSLSRLRKLPVTSIKIDKRFIKGIGKSDADEDIIDLTLALAKKLNINVIAEGIETQSQRDYFLEQGHYIEGDKMLAQGYYYSKAINDDEFDKILKGGNTLLLSDHS